MLPWGGPRWPTRLPQTSTYPALLLLLLRVGLLATADAGVAGDAVEARDAVGGVLPLDPELWGPSTGADTDPVALRQRCEAGGRRACCRRKGRRNPPPHPHPSLVGSILSTCLCWVSIIFQHKQINK